jgi:apolipoprotein D and lipocalin family protein
MLANSFLAFLLALSFSVQARAQVTPVDYVDLSRYLGTWFEIASIPQSFQKQCVGNTRAEYSVAEQGRIKVINSCEKSDKTLSTTEGRAEVVDAASNAKLRVTFVRLIGWIFLFGGDYWIIDLDPNYQYAVVGHPDNTYGWILSRNPELTHDELQNISENLILQGYDTCEFVMTPQDGGQNTALKLCDYLAL